MSLAVKLVFYTDESILALTNGCNSVIIKKKKKICSIKCTLMCLFFLHDSELGRKLGHGDAVPAEYKRPLPATQVPPRSKTKYRSTKEADKSKVGM